MEDAFSESQSDAERDIKLLIDRFNSEQVTKFEQDLFKQRARLADAERSLQTKVTKAATESQRIATDKISWARGKLEDIQRTDRNHVTREYSPAITRRYLSWRKVSLSSSQCAISVALPASLRLMT